jgi:hypothetical protein
LRRTRSRGLRCRFRLAIDFPPDPKRIADDAVAWRPVRRLQRHDHVAPVCQACEYAVRFVGIRLGMVSIVVGEHQSFRLPHQRARSTTVSRRNCSSYAVASTAGRGVLHCAHGPNTASMISSQRNALVLMLRRWAGRAGRHRGCISGCYRRHFEGIDSERGIRLARGQP